MGCTNLLGYVYVFTTNTYIYLLSSDPGAAATSKVLASRSTRRQPPLVLRSRCRHPYPPALLATLARVPSHQPPLVLRSRRRHPYPPALLAPVARVSEPLATSDPASVLSRTPDRQAMAPRESRAAPEWDAAQVRELFFSYSRGRGYKFLPSGPVLPVGDSKGPFHGALDHFNQAFLGPAPWSHGHAGSAFSLHCINMSDMLVDFSDPSHHSLMDIFCNWFVGSTSNSDAIHCVLNFLTGVLYRTFIAFASFL